MSDQHRRRDDENLAYGEDYSQDRGYGDQRGSRSLVGGALNKIRNKVDQYGRPSQDPYGYSSGGSQQSQQYGQSGYQQPSQSQYQAPGPGQPAYVGGPPPQPQQPKPKTDITGKIFSGLHSTVHSIGSDVAGLLGTKYESHHQSYTGGTQGAQGQYGPQGQGVVRNRFDSFARERSGNDVKWYVDGCSYMWAVSEALERARESVWILDWWLSPELYLRRPPAMNEEWRLDRVLKRVADRGVKVNIIVYKEVTQALTLSSSHTKHALEALSPNIGVFRHPDHLPDRQTTHSSITSSLQGLKLDAAGASKLGADALKGLYGLSNDVILYWAHHEKLCVIDKNIAFMGGLDLCYGRWDTNQHSVADVHPSDLNKIMFPGQDYNNARVMDFDDVAHPFQNKLDRTKSSRMGWSDMSICLRGGCVKDLCHHFTDRWNFIYDEKYNVRTDVRYARLPVSGSHQAGEGPQPTPGVGGPQATQSGQFPPPPGSQNYTQPPWQATASTNVPTSTQQYGAQSPSPQPPTTQYSSGQQQYDNKPTTPQPPPGQYGTGQQQTTFPPPPPGPPPHPAQPAYGTPQAYQQQPQSPQPPQAQYSTDYQHQTQTSTSYQQPAQPSVGYQEPTQGSTSYQQPSQPTSSYQQSQPTSSQPIPPQYSAGYQSPPPQPTQTQPSQYSSGYQQGSQTTQPSQAQQNPGYQPTQPSSQPPHQEYSSGYQQSSYSQQPSQPQYQSQYSGQAQELPTSPPLHQQYGPSGTSRGIDEPYEPIGTSRGVDENPDYYSSTQEYDRGRGNSGRGRLDQFRTEGRKLGGELSSIGNLIGHRVEDKVFDGTGKYFGSSSGSRPSSRAGGPMQCQLVRSCTKWSNGTPTEHSIQNAYIDIIMNSQYFIYIENQFFITATGNKQGPVKNQIGKALVDRILRAARNRERYHVIVVMPAIPAFAGDFVDDQSLGTRAICEFQYNSICRGGHSIMEEIAKAGFNPMDYIRFYNLRNYDRINYTVAMAQAQAQSGVSYEDARKQQEQTLGAGYAGQGYQGYEPGQTQLPTQGQQPYSANPSQQYQATPAPQFPPPPTQQYQASPAQQYQGNPAQQYQGAAQAAPNQAADRWDSVASCYMLGGEDIRTVPWSGPPEAELDAFVSEELYIHSKVMIADDRVVICGSANLNDRSMLGYHDSEIALFINDPTPVQSSMAGRPLTVSRFASSLRRQLIRKHLGLLQPQDYHRPDDNFLPLGPPNMYDWGSPEDRVVADPLSDTFLSLWNTRARTNTEVYRKAFRAVPDDYVRTWGEYKEFYEYYFHKADTEAAGKDKNAQKASRVEYGHVVRADFPGGVKELKDLLSKVKGTVVEMPLCFLQNEDIAKEGVALNALTEELYT